MPGPRILPFCHNEWGAVSDLGGSFAERGFKIGHRHCGTTTRGPPLFGLPPNGLFTFGLSLIGLQGQLDYTQLDYL